MSRRDDPNDDWDWLGIWETRPRTRSGCLRLILIVMFLAVTAAVFVAPLWTAYHVGRGTYRDRHWALVGLTLALTVLVLVSALGVSLVGGLHLLMTITGAQVGPRPLLMTGSAFSLIALLGVSFSFVEGRRRRRMARQSSAAAFIDGVQVRLQARRASFAPQPRQR